MPFATMQSTRDLFLQQTQSAEPPPLEMFVKVREPNDFHFYAKGVSFLDLALSFGSELAPLQFLIYRMPPSLLNPNYWEPLTRESETAVREKVTGIVTRQDGEHTLIWRADSIAKGRLLRDGLDVSTELLHGYVFKVSGEGLLKLGRAWGGGKDRFEWIGFSRLPAGEKAQSDLAIQAHADLTSFRFGAADECIIYSAQDDRTVRMLMSQRAWLRRAVAASVRGFVVNLGKQPCALINERVGEQMVRICDGIGFSSDPRLDFTDKGRTAEMKVHVGRTEWGVQLRPGQEALVGDEHILIYYDRISGLWAVAS